MGLGAGMADAQGAAGDINGSLELGAAVGQHALRRPAGTMKVGRHHRAQERGGRGCVVGGQQARLQPIRSRGIAR